jgi:hypothetical protein
MLLAEHTFGPVAVRHGRWLGRLPARRARVCGVCLAAVDVDEVLRA